jgi:hypothetical protein
VMPDIAFTDRTEQGIGDGVAKNVCIRMPFQSAIVRDLDPAQN